MYSETDLIPISALQHALYCERQYALIHIEQVWAENKYTVQGNILHERVDVVHHESRRTSRAEYAMGVRSLEYGLVGKTDLVEFIKSSKNNYVSVIPVEFKRGRTKADNYDLVQLFAQALCLEEMFDVSIQEGQIYYLQEHRRRTIHFTEEIKEQTISAIHKTREIYLSGKTPPAIYDKKKCDNCSLIDMCMPKSMEKQGSDIERYLKNHISRNLKEGLE